ncbi:membrane protein insertase YidC [Salinisphaera sp. Q1T1-3]|uniref:membrane protein insertase YidC n=1 Tax=Salinisphaera sp. Q1T1-3 TaxID=2321229 RepID=UPI000E740D1B|nr:membrane protein insertase YidC [Salinisphaera sp. Q1T1-3]RJS92569.1 membrane protein insertase YidC [Salinisphaera sp. Q1T1-3]
MDNIRFALLCAAAAVCFFLYQAWQTDYAPSSPQVSQQADSAPASNDGQSSDVPDIGATPSSQGSSTASSGSGGSATIAGNRQSGDQDGGPTNSGKTIHVVTDKLDVRIDTLGGGLSQVALRGVPLSSAQPDTNLRLINNGLPDFFVEQSGLIAKDGDAPNHTTRFDSAQDSYKMADGQDTLSVPLTWTDNAGHKVTKVYTFHRGSYKIGLDQQAQNEAGAPWNLSQYVRYWRAPHDNTGDVPFSHAFFGAGWYAAKSGDEYAYNTRSRDDILSDPLSLNQKGGWIAMIQHYFIGAVIPPENAEVRYFARPKAIQGVSGGYATGFVGPQQSVAPGNSANFNATLFIGPKYQDQLAAVAPGLGLTVDYGWFSVLARPIFKVLEFLHSWVGNWGLAIILLTCVIKALFYKLSEIQFRGMARMRKFQPRMAKLKEQYGDDKAELQKKMMELYREEGFNPMAGCWPLLVQMPVFISLYWVLRESVELRHAPFVLWIQDLSAPDPYYILPVVFGLTMFLQQRLNVSAAMDPMQQRIMQIMPIGMAVFFAFFPAGLVLYWCTNNLLTIAQQWYIYRKLDNEGLSHGKTAS